MRDLGWMVGLGSYRGGEELAERAGAPQPSSKNGSGFRQPCRWFNNPIHKFKETQPVLPQRITNMKQRHRVRAHAKLKNNFCRLKEQDDDSAYAQADMFCFSQLYLMKRLVVSDTLVAHPDKFPVLNCCQSSTLPARRAIFQDFLLMLIPRQ